MKRTILMFIALSSILPVQAQLQEEYRTVLYPSEGEQGFVKIEPGNFIEQEVTFAHKDYPVRRTLRVVGGIKMPGKFAPRGEEYFRQQEYLIDENLDSLNVYKDDYALFFQGNNEPFERHAYNRITGVDFSKGYVDLEIAHKRKNLKIASSGDFGIELQIYHKKEGRHPDDVYDAPDAIVYIPIPAGSGNFKVLKKRIELPANTATVLIRIGGTNFSGECWLEAPTFYVDGKNVFSHPFIQNERRQDKYNYWVGVNLATRSRPKWKLEFQGKTIFEGYKFDRASDIADFYIPLPKDIAGKGNLKLTLLKEPHRQAFPYELRSVQLLEESAQDFEIVSVPRYVGVGDTTAILLETNKPNITLKVSADNPNIHLIDKSLTLQHPGLHTVQFSALNPDTKVRFTFSDGTRTQSGLIEQLLVKEKDNVQLSSGDELHIDKEYEPYDPFFKWYFRSRIGNRYHFRPSYQWGGVRITDENVIKHYTSLLNKMHIPYAWQAEGRTLASAKINPSLSSLQSPMFRGKQAHENDGGYYYWQHFLYNGLHSDIAARTRPYGGIFAKHRPIYTDHGIFIHYDPFGVKDMADGANKFIANLSYSRGESTRHTGVTPIFRYLYQAGYDWLGAEQIYGPEDIIMSALRGTSRAYGKTDFGSLHAMQWGSQPFTDPKHSLRFFLSLAVAYIHGSSHINTEEGLWTDEYSNDRYTKAGKEHLYAQHRMLDYIETHSRTGELKTEIAVMIGRNDAWKTFGRTSLWSQKGDKWAFNKAMESFDLLKAFYPENKLDYCSTDGLFTTTPYGLVDILPVEASSEVMNKYKTLIFLGWNTFDNADFIRIKKFVEHGGTLLLGAVHLNSELQPHIPAKFPEDDTVIETLLGIDYKSYKSKTVIPLGKGSIIYYPENVYPADDLIKERYVEDMKNIASNITSKEHEKGWIKPSQNIDFAVWDSDKFRTLYLLNVDWKSALNAQPAKLVLKNHEFNIDVERYAIKTLRCRAHIAAMMDGNTSDILSISQENEQWVITCQTTGEDTVRIFNGQTGKQESRKINSPGIHRVEFL
ncbi:hypothetical protein AGMMS49982_20080 [Bacteroidia bacterium]|nr:hypothetical protein AGMMS49982_20080 [Bacteroidia bacterium]